MARSKRTSGRPPFTTLRKKLLAGNGPDVVVLLQKILKDVGREDLLDKPKANRQEFLFVLEHLKTAREQREAAVQAIADGNKYVPIRPK